MGWMNWVLDPWPLPDGGAINISLKYQLAVGALFLEVAVRLSGCFENWTFNLDLHSSTSLCGGVFLYMRRPPAFASITVQKDLFVAYRKWPGRIFTWIFEFCCTSQFWKWPGHFWLHFSWLKTQTYHFENCDVQQNVDLFFQAFSANISLLSAAVH